MAPFLLVSVELLPNAKSLALGRKTNEMRLQQNSVANPIYGNTAVCIVGGMARQQRNRC
jgi:hypothetical protein